jgi:hypothetical protein
MAFEENQNSKINTFIIMSILFMCALVLSVFFTSKDNEIVSSNILKSMINRQDTIDSKLIKSNKIIDLKSDSILILTNINKCQLDSILKLKKILFYRTIKIKTDTINGHN